MKDLIPRKNGFTLIELVVVITIIGMGSALAIPLVSDSLDRLRLNSAARQVAGILRVTRSHAISEKQRQVFSLDFATKKYLVTTTEDSETTLTVSSGEIPKNVNLKGFSYTGNRDIKDDGTFLVSFFPQGNSTGGRIYLGANSDEEKSFSITVDKISGRVRIITAEKS